ncbi:MAG: hypothetical protein SFU56_11175 [Capsulimonadales bacterium]|nr:hypothetical protein [Capsulimonadales bacterium]
MRQAVTILTALFALAVRAVPVAAQSGGSEEIRTQFMFRHLRPSAFVRQLTEVERLPSPVAGVAPVLPSPAPPVRDLSQMIPDDDRNRLTVRGTKEAVGVLRTLVTLLDVPERLSTLRYRLWFRKQGNTARGTVAAEGAIPEANRGRHRTTMIVERLPIRLDTLARRHGNGALTVVTTLAVDEIRAGDRIHQTQVTGTVLVRPGAPRSKSPQLELTTRDGIFELELLPGKG